jgi:hypothetical protein
MPQAESALAAPFGVHGAPRQVPQKPLFAETLLLRHLLIRSFDGK